jgi:virulence-associated protein VagC
MEDGLKAVLQCQKLIPVTQELVKEGTKEERQIVFKGEFNIFIEGQSKAMKLPAKLEFKDKPEIVQLIQDALNIDRIGEKCLMTVHSNKHGRIDKYTKELEKKGKQQQLDFGPKDEDEKDDTDLDEEEEEEE